MMVEKRFKKMDTIIDTFPIWDTVEEKGYNCTDTLDLLVDLLNELSEEKEYFERKKEYFLSKWSIVNAKNIQLRQEIDDLKEENEQLRQQVQNVKEIAVKNDMQYQICRKEKEDFQDMCEQLRKELDNFKPVIFQDMRKGTVILYSKG